MTVLADQRRAPRRFPDAPSAGDLSLAVSGSGGAGAITAGGLLLQLAGVHGRYGLMRRSFGPQIRGGEAAALIRLSHRPVQCPDDAFDWFLAIDWLNAERFAEQIVLRPTAHVIADPASGPVPELLHIPPDAVIELPMKEIAKGIPGGRENVVAVGALTRCLGFDPEAALELVRGTFARYGEAVVVGSCSAFEAGFEALAERGPDRSETAPADRTPNDPAGPRRWSLTGNEGCGLGALRGGIRFAAAYPITPASDMLEWLAPRLERLGGCLLQAEDELASINMVIGASFGGVPSMTATSGPGLSLMLEGLGLAVAAETPALVIDVQRGGPSTGIPTKSEQADLDQALHGLHGDAPHLVLGALDHADCILTTEWAARLAERLQTVAIVLSDQGLAQSRVLTDPPAYQLPSIEPRRSRPVEGVYQRYATTEDGVSNMAVPGMPGGMHTADGLEHEPGGKPSTAAADHVAQLDKRQRKLADYDFGELWADSGGAEATLLVLTWGSSTAAVREAVRRCAADGLTARWLAPRLLLPARPREFYRAAAGADRVLVVEQSHSRQFYRYLRAHYDLPGTVRVLARPGPLPLTPGEIVTHIAELAALDREQQANEGGHRK